MDDVQRALDTDLIIWSVDDALDARAVTEIGVIARARGALLRMHPDTRSRLAAALLTFGPLARNPAVLVARLGVRILTDEKIPAGLIQFHPHP